MFKNKKAPGVASSSLEMYLNRSQPVTNAYSQSLGGGTGRGEQHDSAENQRRSPNLSVDLNSDLNSEGKKITIAKKKKCFQCVSLKISICLCFYSR